RNWEYELISFYTYSNDESQFNISSRIERSARNDLSFSMDIDWKYDIAEVDTVFMRFEYLNELSLDNHCCCCFQLEMKIYRSPDGNTNEFRPIPYAIPETKASELIGKYYDDLFYSALSHCSNLVKYQDFPNGKFPQKHYEFRRCVVNYSTLPQLMPQGTYKVEFVILHGFKWGVEVVARVTPRII
ncbi:hypothetical protein KR044_010366, partial [Drosophila immigrans]